MIALLAEHPLLTIMVVLALGAAFGQIPFGPLRFGAAGALFVGLAVGALDPALGEGLALVQTLGLALFVYTVGIAAGATFFGDLRRQFPLMALGGGVLAVLAGVAAGLGRLLRLDTALIAGSFAGALTSTPALAAATEATGSQEAAVGYSIGYPVGVTLAIVAVSLVVGRPWPGRRDTASVAGAGVRATSTFVERATALSDIPGFDAEDIKISYLQRADETRVLQPGDGLLVGDRVVVVGSPASVDAAVAHLGHMLDSSLTESRADVDFKRFIVSNPDLAGRTVRSLGFPERFRGVITRVKRGDLDQVARDDMVLQLSDRVLAVVPRGHLGAVREFFGDSQKRVSEIDALATGVGLGLGLLLGTLPIPLPGGTAFSLGSAAGPLLVGMVLGAVHRTGPLIWDLPQPANLTLRQLGLLLFLATVGLASGPLFAARAFTVTGLTIIALAGTLVVAAALLFLAGGYWLGLSAPRATGAFAGLIGQPAILSYATARVNDERIESGYAALFAVGIIVKILLVQVIAAL